MEHEPAFHHYYHVFADGAYWRDAVADHVEVLSAVSVDYRLVLGVVGSAANRAAALAHITSALSPSSVEIHEFDDGWEHRTLQLLADDVAGNTVTAPVLYTHTKGAANRSEDSEQWRRCMERNVVGQWKQALQLLTTGDADAVGAHWLRPSEWPDSVGIPFYGGNYWWTVPSHIKKLPPLNYASRHGAEYWLGLGQPERPGDTVPGRLWPGSTCDSHRDTRRHNVKITF